MIIDIHTHTYPTSDDSQMSPERLIEQAKLVGLDGVCITNHDGFWRREEISELSEFHDYLVLPGSEITTEEGHLLAYGLNKYIFGMHRASFVKRLVDTVGGALVVAHPYRRTFVKEFASDSRAYRSMLDKACKNEVFQMTDAIEIMNGRGSPEENTFSLEIADRLNINGTGASDAHRIDDTGTFATEFERPIRGLEDLIQELKAGRFHAVCLDSSIVEIHSDSENGRVSCK